MIEEDVYASQPYALSVIHMMEENQRTLEFAARFASQKGIARYTRFLDPVQVAAAKQIAREHGAAFFDLGRL
ncbi:MAG: hypothetical protein ACLUHE_17845 [Christensenellales bacterium]